MIAGCMLIDLINILSLSSEFPVEELAAGSVGARSARRDHCRVKAHETRVSPVGAPLPSTASVENHVVFRPTLGW